jgi:hypothetical protein
MVMKYIFKYHYGNEFRYKLTNTMGQHKTCEAYGTEARN